MYEQAAQIRVSVSGNASQTIMSARGMLTRSQSEPGGELPPACEIVCITDDGDNGQRRERAHTAELHQALRRLARAGLGLQFPVIGGNALIQLPQMFP